MNLQALHPAKILKIQPIKTSNAINNLKHDVVKKTVYDELIKKINAIETIVPSHLVKHLTTTQKTQKSERKYLVMMNMLLLMILIKFKSFVERLRQANLEAINDLNAVENWGKIRKVTSIS